MKIEYFHQIPNDYQHGKTFALEMPDKQLVALVIYSLIEVDAIDVQFKFGVGRLHPKDRYTKKLGRNAAVKNVQDTIFTLKCVEIIKDKAHMVFQNEKYILALNFIQKSDKIRLSYVQEKF